MLGVGRIHAYAGSLEGTRAGERAAGDADGLVADLEGIDLRSEAGRYAFFVSSLICRLGSGGD